MEIHYRPGRSDQAADALSCQPVPNVSLEGPVPAKDGEETVHQLTISENLEVESLASRQDSDVELKMIKQYLLDNKLPDQEEKPRELMLNKAQYEVINNVLYHIEPVKTLRIIPPTVDHKGLFEVAHGGVLGGHLRTAKIHNPARQMLLVASYEGRHCEVDQVMSDPCYPQCGQTSSPATNPIPVAGPFNRVGVDVIRQVKEVTGMQLFLLTILLSGLRCFQPMTSQL